MNILEGLNPEQEKAVKHFQGPLLILAGAGSGKTRVLTHRIAFLINEYSVKPWNILALTFTNKAADEMRDRVKALLAQEADDIWVSTFHSTCVRILRRNIESLGYSRNFTIYDGDDQKTLMRDIIKYLNLDPKKYKERAFMSAISSAKDELISVEEYEKMAMGNHQKELFARAYREYERRLHDANALDFDDLICKTVKLFNENPDILEYYQNRFKYIMVDEYQDTNTAQFKLIHLLANTRGENGETLHNLCVVGDDDQSIYKFRGANIKNILNFENSYPETEVIKLEENYRSTQNILDAANAVIRNNHVRKDKSLWTHHEKGDLIYLSQFDSDYDEASSIAAAIAAAVNDGQADYKDFAILYRTNAQSRIFEEKLVTNNIPYRIVGAINFYQRREIKDMLAYLRTIANGLDDISVKRIINVPKRGIGLTTIDRITSYAIEHKLSFYKALQDCDYIDGIKRSSAKINSFVNLIESFKRHLQADDYGLDDLIKEIIEETGYVRLLEEEDTDQAKSRIENIEELVSKVASYIESCDEKPTLSGFLEEIALVADIDNVDESNDLVLLMTLHSAKGLEFPYVYIVGMEDGIFPGYVAVNCDNDNNEYNEEMEEERRLCYVGITRAKEKLSISCAKARFRNGEMQFYRPSRFIDEIPRYLIKQSGPAKQQFTETTSKPVGSYSAADFLNMQPKMQQTPSYPKTDTTNWNPLAENKVKQQNHRISGARLLDNPLIRKGFGNTTSKSVSVRTPDYHAGDRVTHTKFGDGIIKVMTESSGDYMVTVKFDSGITRKMMASFAKLEKK